ncbi:zinc finger, PHD-type containing protein [Tanacetum coccineum]|uniref:Zinc finger, PHD-type containing protein n=1 Tax=Tanacetum coccineum TaxID=301880 RepID=A0ABQ4ZJU7_9ASTR
MSDMTACLNDLNYIPLNNEQNEPTQGIISSHTAKEMTWHATGKCTEPVRLTACAGDTTTYNCLPLCMKESSFMLTLLIPGPKSPGKDIDVYLRPLIDDLKDLWAKPGVETIDVATGLKFNMRAMVLWTINDFPARSSLSGWSGQGYRACPTCNEDTPSVRVLGKTAYVGHRRFLKKPHKWRRSLEFNGETENRDPPREFNRDAIMTQLARLPTRVKGKHPRFGGVKIKRNVLVELNWTKRSIFYELEYWSFLTLKHNLDVMHIEKNVLESILNTLLMNDKSKDTAKARQDLKSLGIRSGLWLGQNKNGKCSKPQAAYSFKPEDRKKFYISGFATGTWRDGKGTRKPNLGGRRAGRQHTRQETRNLGLKAITNKSGPVTIRFEFGDRDTLMPLVPPEQKAGVMARIGEHLQKIYNGKKAALKERHWIPDSDGTYDLERIRLSRPSHIFEVNWDAQIRFWNDPKNRARAAQNKQNLAKSKVVCRQGSRSIAALRDMHMESSGTREYPSLIHTFFLTHIVNGVFLNPEDKALYDEMLRLQGLGSNTETGVPYTEDEIMAIVRGDKSDDKFSQMLTQLESQPEIGGGSGSGGPGDDEQGHDEDDGEDGEDEDDS